MAPRKQSTPQAIYQLKIILSDARPPIWRRVQVSSDTTLGKLHQIIQESMGWTDSHMHAFLIQGVEYGQPMPEFEWDVKNEQRVKLSQVVPGEKFKFRYT